MRAARRDFLRRTGALVLSFTLAPRLAAQQGGHGGGGLPGSLKQAPFLDSGIKVEAGGAVTGVPGKAEVGQGM